MVVHIFSGSKGGIGKTQNAINLTTRLLSENHKTSLFDANVNNIDFFYIMTGKGIQDIEDSVRLTFTRCFNAAYVQKKHCKLAQCPSLKNNSNADYNRIIEDTCYEYCDEIFYRTEMKEISANDKLKALINRSRENSNNYAYVRKSPIQLLRGPTHFWYDLLYVVQEESSNTTKHLVVDTNLTISNLISQFDTMVQRRNRTNTNAKIQDVFKKMQPHVSSVVIWYIWCLNDFLNMRKDVLLQTVQSAEFLSSISDGLFDIKHLMHVINPFMFLGKDQLLKFFQKKANVSDIAHARNIADIARVIARIFEVIKGINIEKFIDRAEIAFIRNTIREINSKFPMNVLFLNYKDSDKNFIKDHLANTINDMFIKHDEDFTSDTLDIKLPALLNELNVIEKNRLR